MNVKQLAGWVLAASAAVGVGALLVTMVGRSDRELALAIEAVAAAAGLAAAALRPLRPERRPAKVRTAPRRSSPAGPDELVRLERAVSLAASQASTLHLTIRPLLREIAAERLRKHGLELDRDLDASHDLLGDPAWDLVRADRHPPRQPFAAGVPLAELAAVVDRLERL